MAALTTGHLSTPAQLERLQQVTRRYARYARSAAGLGNVIGGTLFLVVYFTGGLLDLPGWSRALLGTAPLIYIAAKETLQRRYYQRHGRVTEPYDRAGRRWHIALTGFTALISAGILVYAVIEAVRGDGDRTAPGDIAYLAYVVALPFLVWWFLHTSEEFIVGVGLISQAAVILAGGHYPLLSSATVSAIGAVAMIGLGIRQHAEYRRIEGELRALRTGR